MHPAAEAVHSAVLSPAAQMDLQPLSRAAPIARRRGFPNGHLAAGTVAAERERTSRPRSRLPPA